MKVKMLAALVFLAIGIPVFATDCNTDCEGHFDGWWQGPDLARCRAERAIACRTNLTTCDIWQYNAATVAGYRGAIEAITLASAQTGQPANASACHSAIDLGSSAASAGSAGRFAYQVWNYGFRMADILSRSTVIGLVVSEGAKHFAHCACTNARYQSVQNNRVKVGINLDLYCQRAYGANFRGRARAQNAYGLVCQDQNTGTMYGIDMRQACIWEHGTDQAGFDDFNRNNSWYCLK